jgi:hypothetical protein
MIIHSRTSELTTLHAFAFIYAHAQPLNSHAFRPRGIIRKGDFLNAFNFQIQAKHEKQVNATDLDGNKGQTFRNRIGTLWK